MKAEGHVLNPSDRVPLEFAVLKGVRVMIAVGIMASPSLIHLGVEARLR